MNVSEQRLVELWPYDVTLRVILELDEPIAGSGPFVVCHGLMRVLASALPCGAPALSLDGTAIPSVRSASPGQSTCASPYRRASGWPAMPSSLLVLNASLKSWRAEHRLLGGALAAQLGGASVAYLTQGRRARGMSESRAAVTLSALRRRASHFG